MHGKSAQSIAFSTIGIVIALGLAVAINIIATKIRVRVDMTEDKVFTLSDGSKDVMTNISSPVILRFYCTRGQSEVPPHIKNFARRVEDLLEEYVRNSGGKVRLERFNPQPDTDEEDTARLDGIRGQQLPSGDRMYLGLAISCIGETETIPVLSMNDENNLEYEISRAIYRVANPEKATIGVMSALPIMGSGGSAQFMMPGQRQPAWLFVDMLKKDFEVETVAMDPSPIPETVKTLIIMHPKGMSPDAMFKVDQFLLRGGKVIAMVDPMSYFDMSTQPPRQQFGPPPATSSTMDELFNAWGVEFTSNQAVVDMTYAFQTPDTQMQRGQFMPAVLRLNRSAVDADDVATNSLDQLMMVFTGSFTGDGAEGLEKTVLIKSSAKSQLMDPMQAQQPRGPFEKAFKPDDKEHAIAIRLMGKFKTAFPDGAPSAGNAKEGDEPKKPDHLTESVKDSAVILIGDSDFIHDQFWAQRINFGGQQMVSVTGDNNNLLRNFVEQLSGDTSLISIRSRGLTDRPLQVILDRRIEAAKQTREEIAKYQQEIEDAQKRLNELARTTKDANQKYVLSAELLKERKQLEEKEIAASKRMRELRKQERKEINALENKAKAYNIAAMPLVVIIIGIGVSIFGRRRR
jgi:ABC-type uncharacterized transport system involved in gliding motility auxiliary subunit